MFNELTPRIIAEYASYLVVYKPPLMHSAPLRVNETQNLFSWCAKRFPQIRTVHGKKEIEGGLLHRLDRDTRGLILIARTQNAYDALAEQQEAGFFEKEYRALCFPQKDSPTGFPANPLYSEQDKKNIQLPVISFTLESAFRSYGPGQKSVRPVVDMERGKGKGAALDQNMPYRTEISSYRSLDDGSTEFHILLRRGFRHQIRSHLAWIGYPILGDTLYGGKEADILQLYAEKLRFKDPENGSNVEYCYSPV